MKKILFLISVLILAIGCENRDINFDDFEFQAVYFPYQTPIRTIMLGDEVVGDNSIDRDHAFSIGVSIGGMYSNERDREVAIEYAPELAQNIMDENSGKLLEILPQEYYTATFDKITIPKGSFFGKMRVELKDAFFEDPDAIGLKYVIPLIITDAFGDSILSGEGSSTVVSPDRRIAADWTVVPKDYTLFAVKYINTLHGVYLLRGQSINTTVVPNDTISYSKRFLIDNDMVKLTTRSLDQCSMPVVGGVNRNGKYRMLLSFDETAQNMTVSRFDSTTVVVAGSGKFYTKEDAEAESYTDYKHRTIYLDYTFEDGGNTFQVNDSLVFIDTDMKFEEFKVGVY
ncbi:MAG: DUF5627 domain-containing protein [Bacteroidales bacterium]|nr:DUF5627 domain-containing protein [Bacteroidales bacterium]